MNGWKLFFLLIQFVRALKFSDVTSELNLHHISGQIAAFADFNSDKATDILVLNNSGTVQELYLWDVEDDCFTVVPFTLDVPSPVVAVRVGDFNGDGLIDILSVVGAEPGGDGCLSATVHWTTLKEGRPMITDSSFLFNTSLASLLLVLDFNGDHISDILSTSCLPDSVDLILWISHGEKREFHSELIPAGSNSHGAGYNSAYYLDLSLDCVPELVVFSSGAEGKWLKVWNRMEKGFNLQSHITLPFGPENITSPPTFVDMDRDGINEAVILSCGKADYAQNICTRTSIHILFQSKFPGSDVIHCQGSDSWRLKFVKNISIVLNEDLSVPLETITSYPVLGDLNLDSYPDMVLPITKKSSNGSQQLLVLLGSKDGTLQISINKYPSSYAKKVNFFDLWEDGILDVLVVKEKSDGDVSLSAYKQSLSAGHTFLKVLVLSGHCYTNCASGKIPYGSVLAGSSIAYFTTDRNGHTQHTRATPKPSTDPLQLPFIIFGLGETPNFIEELTIGAVIASDTSAEWNATSFKIGFHKWRNLVPNSQVIVIPTPLEQPGSWHLELYLTPSHLMFTTAGVLCAVAVGMAIIIAVLHAREKYQDHQERKQAKHKFHFNAM